MRLSDTGRACHPKMRANCFRMWPLDEAAIGSASDAARGLAAAVVGTDVPVTQGATGRARVFTDAFAGGLSEAAASVESRNLMEGDWTMHMLVRLTAAPSGSDVALSYSGDNAADVPTDPNNHMGTGMVLTDRRPSMFWEHSAGTDVQVSASAYDVPLYKPTLLTWRKSNSTGPGSAGGTARMELLVNGHVVPIALGTGTIGAASQTVTNTSHGSAARWKLGHQTSAIGSPTDFLNGHIISAAVYAGALTDEEVWEDVRRLYQLPFFAHVDLRFDLETQTSSIMQDMTNLAGVDWVDKAEVNAEVDQPCDTGSVSLFREVGDLSLSILRTDSKLNLTDPLNPVSYSPRLLEGRACELWAARVPLGLVASGDDWVSVLKGHVDDVDEGGAETVQLTLRDQGGLLVDTFIEETVSYGAIPPVAVEGEMQFVLNDNDSSAINNSVAGLVARNGSYPPLTLFTPTPPGWAVTRWKQRREGVLSALRTLAGQVAWEVRYRFDQNPDQNAWRLTFFDPDRLREDVDSVLLADDLLEVTRFSRSILGVRNVVRVIYPSSETVTPVIPVGLLTQIAAQGFIIRSGWNNVDGEANRVTAYVEIESPGSIALVRRRLFMEIGEASTSQIDTIVEAATMAFGALLDLQESPLEKGMRMPMLFELELNDMLKFGPDMLTTAPQRLAVKSITHSFDDVATTSVQLRGKPTVGFKRWMRLETRQGNARPGVLKPQDANADVYEGQLLGVMRNLLDRSAAFKGGKFLQVRNPEFQGFASGLQNPPDGWAMRAGVWGTDINAESATQLSGGKAVKFLTATGQLESDFIQVNGSRFTPYSFEGMWQRTSVNSGSNNASLSASVVAAISGVAATISGAAGSTATFTTVAASFNVSNSIGAYVDVITAANSGNVCRAIITAVTSVLTCTIVRADGGTFVNEAATVTAWQVLGVTTFTAPTAIFSANSVGGSIIKSTGAQAGTWEISMFLTTTTVKIVQEPGSAGGDFTNNANNFDWIAPSLFAIDVEFYDASKVLLAGKTYQMVPHFRRIPSFAVDGLSATINAWFSSRGDGVFPPDASNARWVKMVLRVVGAFSPVIVDDVSAYKTGLDVRSYMTTFLVPYSAAVVGWWPVEYNPKKSIERIGRLLNNWDWGVCLFTTATTGVSTFGQAITGDVALPNWSGWGFYAREDGTYVVTCICAITTNNAGGQTTQLRFVKNATLSNTGATVGRNLGTGTVIAQGMHQDCIPIADLGNAGFGGIRGTVLLLQARVRLNRGDRVTVEWYMQNTNQSLQTSGVGDISLFSVKQEITE